MSWTNTDGYKFDLLHVMALAPSLSGVYGLRNSERWIHIGETENIQQRLTKHLLENISPIKTWGPLSFSFEPVPEWERVQRWSQLMSELCPACGQEEFLIDIL